MTVIQVNKSIYHPLFFPFPVEFFFDTRRNITSTIITKHMIPNARNPELAGSEYIPMTIESNPLTARTVSFPACEFPAYLSRSLDELIDPKMAGTKIIASVMNTNIPKRMITG
jgi:hypothetical protein